MKVTITDFGDFIEKLYEPGDPPGDVGAGQGNGKAENGATSGEPDDHIGEAPWPMMAPAAYHGLAGEVVARLLPHTESDPAALLLQYLVSFGNAVGRHPFYRIEATDHFTNLFALLIGDTAMARKGTSAQHIRRVMQIADPQWARYSVTGGISSGEGIIHAIRDPIFTLKKGIEEETDPGVTDKRVLFIEHEFSSVLSSMQRQGNTVERIIRDAWDSLETLRTVTKHSPSCATYPHISITGHITLAELRKKLDETSMADGFGNRFLYACVRRSKSLPHGGNLDDDTVGRLGAATLEALTAANTLTRITMAPAAYELWIRAYDGLTKGKDSLLDHLVSRAAPQTIRLALIYACLDHSAHIEQAHLEAALAVWSYCEASARFIFSDLAGDRVTDTILSELRLAGILGLDRWSINNAFNRHVSAGKISAALLQLVTVGKIRREMRPSSPTGGRPREMWFII